jgi:hypothetical protein
MGYGVSSFSFFLIFFSFMWATSDGNTRLDQYQRLGAASAFALALSVRKRREEGPLAEVIRIGERRTGPQLEVGLKQAPVGQIVVHHLPRGEKLEISIQEATSRILAPKRRAQSQ